VCKAIILIETIVIIVGISLYTAKQSKSIDSEPMRAAQTIEPEEPEADVIVSGQTLSNDAATIEIPITGEKPDNETDDITEICKKLARRLETVHIQFSQTALILIGKEINDTSYAHFASMFWLQHKQYGILLFQPPGGSNRENKCFVFEAERYKGFIQLSGWVDTEDYFVEHGNNIWLSSLLYNSGTDYGAEERQWHCLTSNDIDLQLRYTEKLAKQSAIYVEYVEKITNIETENSGNIIFQTEWTENISSRDSAEDFKFQRSGNNRYVSHSLRQTYDEETGGDYLRFLSIYYDEFKTITETGTPQQQQTLLDLIRLVQYAADQQGRNVFLNLEQFYNWYLQNGNP